MKLQHLLYGIAAGLAGLAAVLTPLWWRRRQEMRREAARLYLDAIEAQARERREGD
jgi:type II secretory pathway pseudopilin PulG